MNKTGKNAHWNELTIEQLDRWLFEDKMSYAASWERARAELGFKGSVSSVRRYCTRRRAERQKFRELQNDVAKVNAEAADLVALRTASMKLAGAHLFEQLRTAPEKVKEWAPVAQLMVSNDYNEALRELKGEENRIRKELRAEEHRIRREALALAKQRFEFKTIERALTVLPELNQLAEAKKDPHLKRYEENARWNRLRRGVFGPDSEVSPESEQEEAEMLAAQKEREARKAAAERRERERIHGTHPPTPSSPYYKEYMEAMARKEAEENQHENGEERMEDGPEYEI
jgi:hypothetical protein